MQGVVLMAANLTTIIAGLSPIGIGIAQPVRESGHSLAVLIGVLFFQEYGPPDMRFVVSLLAMTCLNVAGIFALVFFGSAPS